LNTSWEERVILFHFLKVNKARLNDQITHRIIIDAEQLIALLPGKYFVRLSAFLNKLLFKETPAEGALGRIALLFNATSDIIFNVLHNLKFTYL
jgi:hypothetical protein